MQRIGGFDRGTDPGPMTPTRSGGGSSLALALPVALGYVLCSSMSARLTTFLSRRGAHKDLHCTHASPGSACLRTAVMPQ